MLRSRTLRIPSLLRALPALAVIVASAPAAWAQYTYVPSNNQNGNWNATARWTGGPAGTFPNAVDATATIATPASTNPTANYNLQLSNTPGQSITVGAITINHGATATFNTRVGANGNGTLTFQTSAGPATYTENASAPTDNATAVNIFAPVTFASDTVFTQNHRIDNNNGTSFTSSANSPGGITAPSNVTFTKEGAGNVTFEVAPSAPATGFQGSLVVNNGAVRLESNVFANAAAVTVNPGGQFQLGSSTVTNWSLAPGATLTLNGAGKAAGTANPSGALRFQNQAATASFDNAVDLASDSTIFVNATLTPTPPDPVTLGHLTLSQTVSGEGGLTKTGGGILELTQANSYIGNTIVSEGILLVSNATGSATGSGSVTVNAGAALAGSGLIAGPVSLAGGTLAPGSSPGVITLGSTTLDSASILAYELDQPGVVDPSINDLTQVLGDLVLDGTLNVTALAGFGAGTYRLFDYSGQLTDNLLELGSLPVGFSGLVDLSIPGQVNLEVVAVPEPSTLVLAGLGLVGLYGAARRRRALKIG